MEFPDEVYRSSSPGMSERGSVRDEQQPAAVATIDIDQHEQLDKWSSKRFLVAGRQLRRSDLWVVECLKEWGFDVERNWWTRDRRRRGFILGSSRRQQRRHGRKRDVR